MWNLVLYVLATLAGLILYLVYEFKPKEKEGEESRRGAKPPARQRVRYLRKRASSFLAILGIPEDTDTDFEAFRERFSCLEEVSQACQAAGLESSNLIVGIDFTASNEWQGKRRFKHSCLHQLRGSSVHNPYQKVIWILGNTLKPFDEDNLIPAYGFGDASCTDKDVFPFKANEEPCHGFEEVMQCYNDVVRHVTLSGPTSFAPIIKKAIQIVRHAQTYHILVIIADGQVTEEEPTIDAIVEASLYPLSIIVVGVGDGPWDIMEEFDHRLPARKFDNFHFVDYHQVVFKTKNLDAAFALQTLMEIPDQYKKIKSLGYLGPVDDEGTASKLAPPVRLRRHQSSTPKPSLDRNGNSTITPLQDNTLSSIPDTDSDSLHSNPS